MVVKKGGTPVSAKKKNVEEMKKLNEKKKMMMEEESEEEDTSEEVEEDDSESGDDELHVVEGSEDDDIDDEDEEDDDDDEDDEEDDDEDESDDEDDAATSQKTPKKGQIQTLAKSAKTPNKQAALSPQKSEVQSNLKTPNKKKNAAQNESLMTVSPKKLGKSNSDSAKTSPLKQQKNASLPEKRKREAGDDGGLPKKPRADLPGSGGSFLEQRKQRDIRCLFIRQFPQDTTEDDIKALSPDILSVRIPHKKRKGKYDHALFGFVEFASEEKAEENFPVLQKAKIKGQKLYVDYVGEKSKTFASRSPPPNRTDKPENRKKLFISGIPQTATMEDIAKSFPNAMNIFMKSTGNQRIANVEFENEAAGQEALKQNSSLKIKGQNVMVMFAMGNKSSKRKVVKKRQQPGQQRGPKFVANQKQVSKKPDEDDDDESDEGESDEEDEDDSDDE